MLPKLKKIALSAMVFHTIALTSACGPTTSDSAQKVTTVAATPSKRQSIGNCWIYAQASWLEALLLKSNGEAVNVSETYWTYWDWFHKITDNPSRLPGEMTTDEMGRQTFGFQTGGNWSDAKRIILKYGYLHEGEVAAGG